MLHVPVHHILSAAAIYIITHRADALYAHITRALYIIRYSPIFLALYQRRTGLCGKEKHDIIVCAGSTMMILTQAPLVHHIIYEGDNIRAHGGI